MFLVDILFCAGLGLLSWEFSGHFLFNGMVTNRHGVGAFSVFGCGLFEIGNYWGLRVFRSACS